MQYLDGGRELLVIPAQSGDKLGNGLAAPRPLDVDGNGTADVVYAGDLLGNFWKFDLTRADPARWGVADWGGSTVCQPGGGTTCQPLMTAVDATGTGLVARTNAAMNFPSIASRFADTSTPDSCRKTRASSLL